ncbi:hypothetical protein CHF27_012685 [Romboutsia maritimum]|uniref:Rod shape-determining protein MreD n=1 Tax=Romboutsia maritimum TaxID=2020948 RepID=A0A371IQ17_9FIRM|nr:hypothetical protein [Romboutsia maritimum]RDY22574.1 hypothetical protein CHF27_012685 [Romboutsia maritimum]
MSKKVAYGGILLALNIILLMLLNIIPINTLFLLGLASLPVSIIIMEWGIGSGIAFYIGSVILGFIVMSNKSQWIIYIFTFGIYGIIKYLIEKDRPIYIEYILKFLFANIVLLIMYFILKEFIYIPINLISVVSFEVVFLIYDHMYTLFIEYYNYKIKNLINKI